MEAKVLTIFTIHYGYGLIVSCPAGIETNGLETWGTWGSVEVC